MNVDNYRYRMEMDASRARWRMWWRRIFRLFTRKQEGI